jgi:C4-type Zn-finger protein
MATAQSTVTPSPKFVPHCPVCGEVSATVTQLQTTVPHVAQLLYLCPQDHGWIVKWVAA